MFVIESWGQTLICDFFLTNQDPFGGATMGVLAPKSVNWSMKDAGFKIKDQGLTPNLSGQSHEKTLDINLKSCQAILDNFIPRRHDIWNQM